MRKLTEIWKGIVELIDNYCADFTTYRYLRGGKFSNIRYWPYGAKYPVDWWERGERPMEEDEECLLVMHF